MAGRRIDAGAFGIDDDSDLEAGIRRELQRWGLFDADDEEPEADALGDRTAEAGDRPRILVAEDDRDMRVLIASSLRSQGYFVTECDNGVQLLDRLAGFLLPQNGHRYDLVISDIRMPGVTGLEVLKGLYQCVNAPPMVLITAFGDQQTHESAARAGAAAVFDKPFELNDLLTKVREIIVRPKAGPMGGSS